MPKAHRWNRASGSMFDIRAARNTIVSAWCFFALAIVGPASACAQSEPPPQIKTIAAPAAHDDSQSGSDQDSAPNGTQTREQAAPANKQETHANNSTTSEKKGEWLLAPIPVSSPAIGSGLEW